MNKVNTATPTGPASKRACAAVALAFFLLSGCESLGPAGAKKLPTPPSLVAKDKIHDEPLSASAANENKGATKTEIYPPSGALFGSPDLAGKAPADKPFHPKEGKYDLSFEDADVAEVARAILSDYLKATCVVNPKVTGKITIKTTRKLAEDELIPTLELLLKANGAVLIRDHSIYRVEPEANATVSAASTGLGLAGQAMPPGFQLRVVPLRYVGVAEMQKVIEPLMPPKSVVRADESRNLLLLAGTLEELDSVLETIRIFDVDFMRGMSVALFPLKNVEASTIAEELDKLLTVSGKGPLAGMFRLMPIERLNSILVVTPQPRYLDEVQTWIERLDRYNTTKTGNMHVYRVQNVDALELANTLSNIFGQGQGRGRTPGASLAPGLTGSSVSGGASSGMSGTTDGLSSSGFGGSSSSGFGGSSSSGVGGSSSSGFGGSSSSGFGGGTSGSMAGGGTMGTGSTGSGGFGAGAGRSTTGGFGASGQGRNRGSVVADLGNNMRIVADPSNNALIILAKPQEYRDIEAVIKELDVVPLQVLIDATIVEVSLKDELQYGLQWLFTHGEMATALTTASNADAMANAAAIAAAASSGGFAYALAGNNIKLLINALAVQNKINVISSPSLMVLNNQEAAINVGDRVPTPTSTATNTNATTPFVTSTIQYQESGVTLKVRPRVNAGGLVIMEIIQEISTPSKTDVGGVQTFQFAQRKIQSQVAVVGGDTLALGGLISDRQSNAENGIPYLHEIPWLGPLFGSTLKNVERTEMVVLLTPRVVEKRQDVSTVTNEFRRKLTGLADLYEKLPNPYIAPVPLNQGTGAQPNVAPVPLDQGTGANPN